MTIYDRGLLLGSCTGEAFGWPVIIFVTVASIAVVTWLLARRFGLNLRALIWAFTAAAVLGAGAAGAASAFSHLTARLERSGDVLAVETCFGRNLSRETVPVSDVSGRFIVSQTGKSPARPFIRLFAHQRELGEVWVGHPGVNLEALAALAPGAMAEYRRWRNR